MTAITPESPAPVRDGYDLPELESLDLYPDQIMVGDYIGGLEVTQITKADHYREPAVRLTLETDPEMHEVQAEVGRLVLITDRRKIHTLPIERPLPYKTAPAAK